MKKTLFILISLIPLFLFSQEEIVNSSDLQEEVIGLKKQIESIEKQVQRQNAFIRATSKELNKQRIINDSLYRQIEINSQQRQSLATKMGTEIQNTQNSLDNNISRLDQNIHTNKIYWIVGTLVLIVIGALMFFVFRRRISAHRLIIERQLKNTKQSLEEEGLKLDNKLIEILESQLKLRQEELQVKRKGTETDHSLALKVADEIARMQKNLTRFEENTKGVKPLEKGIERIQANFAANGYEIISLLNEDFDERMNVDVINFIQNDSLEQGKRIITKIIRPQVNYSGILVQRAQVEVSQN